MAGVHARRHVPQEHIVLVSVDIWNVYAALHAPSYQSTEDKIDQHSAARHKKHKLPLTPRRWFDRHCLDKPRILSYLLTRVHSEFPMTQRCSLHKLEGEQAPSFPEKRDSKLAVDAFARCSYNTGARRGGSCGVGSGGHGSWNRARGVGGGAAVHVRRALPALHALPGDCGLAVQGGNAALQARCATASRRAPAPGLQLGVSQRL